MTEIRLPIKFRLSDEQKFKKDAREYFENHKKLRPVRFGYTTDYAESLEYGTGPLNDFQPTVNGGDYTYKSIYNNIYEWAGKKDGHGSGLPITDEKARKEFAKVVTDKFFAVGMRPHPYWRPAINFLIENQQRLFDEGHSLFEIADEALRVANKCIMDQNLPFTGKLQQSAFIDEINPKEIGGDKYYEDYTEDERNALYKKVGWI